MPADCPCPSFLDTAPRLLGCVVTDRCLREIEKKKRQRNLRRRKRGGARRAGWWGTSVSTLSWSEDEQRKLSFSFCSPSIDLHASEKHTRDERDTQTNIVQIQTGGRQAKTRTHRRRRRRKSVSENEPYRSRGGKESSTCLSEEKGTRRKD